MLEPLQPPFTKPGSLYKCNFLIFTWGKPRQLSFASSVSFVVCKETIKIQRGNCKRIWKRKEERIFSVLRAQPYKNGPCVQTLGEGKPAFAGVVLSNVTPNTNQRGPVPEPSRELLEHPRLLWAWALASWHNPSLSIYVVSSPYAFIPVACKGLVRLSDFTNRRKEKCSCNVLLCSENIKKNNL